LEERLDELPHPPGSATYPFQVVQSPFIEAVGAVLSERLAETLDVPQRRLQVVGDRIAERLQLPVHLLQFGGPLATSCSSSMVKRCDSAWSAAARSHRGQDDLGRPVPHSKNER